MRKIRWNKKTYQYTLGKVYQSISVHEIGFFIVTLANLIKKNINLFCSILLIIKEGPYTVIFLY